jgi:RES domain-containing protein
LATLEYLAHIDRQDVPKDLVRVDITFDHDDLEELKPPYPAQWDGLAPSAAARLIGDRWVREARTLALAVPSVVVPTETNYLINPAHPRMPHAKIGPLRDYALDERLLRS